MTTGKLIELTPHEKEHLLFDAQHYFEILPGMLSRSRVETDVSFPNVESRLVHARFFLATQDSHYGIREWGAYFLAVPEEGPTLAVLYGDRVSGNVSIFGLISVASRAWLPIMPLTSITAIDRSAGMQAIRQMARNHHGFLGMKARAKVLQGSELSTTYAQKMAAVEATTRSFLFRLAQATDQYWQSGGSTSGKL